MTASVTIAAVVAADEHQGRPHDAAAIARALASEGGHLIVGHGGYTIYFAQGWLSGGCPETVKRMALAVGLPVIDSRQVPFDAMARIAISGPMVAVGRAPSSAPYDVLSYAPLAFVAALYRTAGAEVRNIPACRFANAQGTVLPPPSTAAAGQGRARAPSLLQRLRNQLRASPA